MGDTNPGPFKSGPPSPERRGTRAGDNNPSPFDWTSPRWRDGEHTQGEVEKDRREHNTKAPSKDTHGAIRHTRDKQRKG